MNASGGLLMPLARSIMRDPK